MRVRENVPLAELTTLRLGGPARRLVEAADADEAVAAVREAEAAGEPLLVMAGGSNLVVADEGFAGTVVRVASRGVARSERDGRVELEVAAGEPWDAVVAGAVADGLAGIECLSGIPGATGATPIQNVGAYGQEVADTISRVRVYDRETGSVSDLAPAECGFAYRSSAFRRSDRHVVLAVAFALPRSARSAPLRYAELARTLDVALGGTAPLHDVREAVLELRRSKGMVAGPRRPRLGLRRVVLHQPDPRPRGLRRAGDASRRAARARRAPASVPRARRPRQDVGGLADRASRLRARIRRGPRATVRQAHAGDHQPGRRHRGRARRAGARAA